MIASWDLSPCWVTLPYIQHRQMFWTGTDCENGYEPFDLPIELYFHPIMSTIFIFNFSFLISFKRIPRQHSLIQTLAIEKGTRACVCLRGSSVVLLDLSSRPSMICLGLYVGFDVFSRQSAFIGCWFRSFECAMLFWSRPFGSNMWHFVKGTFLTFTSLFWLVFWCSTVCGRGL